MTEEESGLEALLRKANEQLVRSSLAAKEATLRGQALREETDLRNEELQTIIESIADAVFVCDASGAVSVINSAALALIGKGQGEPIGGFPDIANVLRLQFPDGRLVHVEDLAMTRALRLGEAETGRERMAIHPKTQQRCFLLVSAAPLHDQQGQVIGAVEVATDVTRMRELQERHEEFVALISHDLRTPLTNILGLAQLTQRTMEQKGLKLEARRMESLVKSAKRMDLMIRELVESSRLEAGRLELRKEPVDAIHLTSELAESVGTQDRRRIKVEAPEWVPPVLADAAQVERALTNILTNALKYSPVDEPVVVRVGRRDDQAEISVTDQGVGIPSDELPHVFERNFRAKTSGEHEGLGLGLYIARLIVEAHGGKVSAESEVGKGSTFCISLPLA